MYETGLFIFRRDLRINDNTAFYQATKKCKTIIPIFIFTPLQIDETKNDYKSNKSVQFMIETLGDLEKQLQQHNNGSLFFFYGENESVLSYLIGTLNIDAVFINKDYTPYSKKRDTNIKSLCDTKNIAFHSYHDVCLFEPGSILTMNNDTYQKYTPFYNKCIKNTDKIEPLKKINFKGWYHINDKTNIKYSISLREAYIKYTVPNEKTLVVGGRENGLHIIQSLNTFKNYEDTRNYLDKETTQLSAYLKFGCVSVREVYFKLKQLFGVRHAIIRQLIWRDFYIHLLNAFPNVLQGQSLKEKYDNIKWNNNKQHFQAWKKGETGFPIVDACMRQLNTTGYMHNRGRLIVASFLIKNLMIDWRWGEKYFATKLVDYDPAANNGNWQWVAGSGADSQPYFRIFNPWSQSKKYDKNAEYIKQWIPELKDVSSKHIHTWEKAYSKYKDIKYPKPIIDYEKSRKEVIELYKKYI